MRRATQLFALQDRQSAVVAVLRPYEVVQALSGEVWITEPGRARVMRDYGRYSRGEIVYLLTYLGEGVYRGWHRGELGIIGGAEMDDPRAFSRRCVEKEPICWGRWEKDPETTWWVRIRSAAGTVGWTGEPAHFGNTHGCGSDAAEASPIIECIQRGGKPEQCAGGQ